jgi:hypothetical protein
LQKSDIPDSGWRFHTKTAAFSEEEIRSSAAAYVPLGAVLDLDPSWTDVVDEPLGVAFSKTEAGSHQMARNGTRLGEFLFVMSKTEEAA